MIYQTSARQVAHTVPRKHKKKNDNISSRSTQWSAQLSALPTDVGTRERILAALGNPLSRSMLRDNVVNTVNVGVGIEQPMDGNESYPRLYTQKPQSQREYIKAVY